MKINAKIARETGRSYTVFVDGVDLSDCCCEADNIAHEVTVFVRTRAGEDIRRTSDGKRITAVIRGQVVITERIGAAAVGARQ